MKRSILILLVVVAAAIGGVVGSMITIKYFGSNIVPYTSINERQALLMGNNRRDSLLKLPDHMNFLDAASDATASVVHIRTSYGSGNFSVNPLQFYFDTPARSSGSGVIITDDGYIVTNYHVIQDATNIEIVMNDNQRFFAKLVGTDETTDLALLKIKAKDLPFVPYGNSDSVQPGEWVLAIGNPFDLNSTVTAGIVSAKARNIGILRDRNNLQVESFIQTDAAVNPGNSGGALVNLRGELIGINTAIATSTGSYQGYSFAIPVSLVSKVMDDLLEFGKVQRGMLGVQITDVNARIAEDLKLPVSQGVLVNHVNARSAAAESGIVSGDVIVGIDGHEIRSVSELQEYVARHRPGTRIAVDYLRDGVVGEVTATLKNFEGNDEVQAKEVKADLGGAHFEAVPYKELTDLPVEGGVRISNISGEKWRKSGIEDGFVIAFIDKIPVETLEDLNRILDFKKGGILVEGYSPDGEHGTYGVEW